jgi:hypothetical protein
MSRCPDIKKVFHYLGEPRRFKKDSSLPGPPIFKKTSWFGNVLRILNVNAFILCRHMFSDPKSSILKLQGKDLKLIWQATGGQWFLHTP